MTGLPKDGKTVADECGTHLMGLIGEATGRKDLKYKAFGMTMPNKE